MIRHPIHPASRQPYQAMLNYYSPITYIPDSQFNLVPKLGLHSKAALPFLRVWCIYEKGMWQSEPINSLFASVTLAYHICIYKHCSQKLAPFHITLQKVIFKNCLNLFFSLSTIPWKLYRILLVYHLHFLVGLRSKLRIKTMIKIKILHWKFSYNYELTEVLLNFYALCVSVKTTLHWDLKLYQE